MTDLSRADGEWYVRGVTTPIRRMIHLAAAALAHEVCIRRDIRQLLEAAQADTH